MMVVAYELKMDLMQVGKMSKTEFEYWLAFIVEWKKTQSPFK